MTRHPRLHSSGNRQGTSGCEELIKSILLTISSLLTAAFWWMSRTQVQASKTDVSSATFGLNKIKEVE
jgi:hypothetical protein